MILGECDLVLVSGTSSLSTRVIEFGLGNPTLVGVCPGSWQLDGLAKILAREFLHGCFLLWVFAIV